jgi:hypothetical protein
MKCGDLEIRISQSPNHKEALIITFDQTTSKSFMSGQWYLNSAELRSAINTLLDTGVTEIPKT